MKFALWTLRAPKIQGIREWIQKTPYFNNEEIEIAGFDVDSGIPAMPLDITTVMQGALNRAKNVRGQCADADYYVGIEGGTTRVDNKAYIFWSVYLESSSGEGHFGFSPFVEVPSLVDAKLYQEGMELGPLMGELSGKANVRSENGSMGAWTDDMLIRSDEFSAAFKAAIAPFYNAFYKL